VTEARDWDSFFDELYLETYAPRQAPEEAEEEARAVIALAGCEPGSDVLDCPCGFGRHSIPLARAGYRVVGVDRSGGLLDEARRRAGEAEWPRWVQADYRELPFEDASFDAVLNLFSSLGYAGDEGDRQALAEFRRVLRPGGALVVETMHRDRLAAIFRPRDWEPLPDGRVVVEERGFDLVRGTTEVTHTLVREDGRRSSFSYSLRIYTATELARMLADAGFAETEFFGGFDREPLTRERRLVALART
jgi:ubiquinone/menaquinone biosynthesis C-methylase UbiE